MVEQAVVLAAGEGRRLRALANGRPKCLVPVAGRPLIDRVLQSITDAGIRQVLVVVGYCGDQIQRHVGAGVAHGVRVRYVANPDYERGNATSFRCALRDVRGRPFLLTMADHIFETSLLRTFLAGCDGRIAVAVDRSRMEAAREEEATKVALRDGRIVDIGKGLRSWDGVDTGFSYWPPQAGELVDESMCGGELAALMAELAQRDPGLAGRDVSGHLWFDVDTVADVASAERLLQAAAGTSHSLASRGMMRRTGRWYL